MISSKGTKGVTLIELMVVITALGIVLGLTYSIFISQLQTSMWRRQLADRKQNLNSAVTIMIQDFLKADLVKAFSETSGPFVYTTCVNAISVKDGNRTITYLSNGTRDDPGWLQRRYNDPDAAITDQTTIVAENITSLSMTCYDRNGAEMSTPLAAGEEIDIRRVTIALSGKTAKPRPGTNVHPETTITTSIELRNIPQYTGSGCGVLYFTLSPTAVAFCDPPGEKPTLTVHLCSLIGNALGGDVKIYPKGGLPINITGTGGTTVGEDAEGTAIMNIPAPATGALCRAGGTEGTAEVTAVDASDPALTAGMGLEMVAVWTPGGCSYDISTSRSLTIEAGDPYKFENNALGIEPGMINACSSSQADLNVRVTDNCGNSIMGETVTLSIIEDPGDDTWGTIDPLTATDNGNGTYSSVYNAGTMARHSPALVIQAQDLGLVNATNQTITNTITLNPHTLDHLLLTSEGTITMNECPGNTSRIDFEVRDACNNTVIDNQTAKLSAATLRGSVNAVAADGNAYYTIYNTSASCGPGTSFAGEYTVDIDHSGIGVGADLTVELDLGQCPSPGLNLSAPSNNLAAGCPDETVQFTTTIYKNDCEPDAQPAWITFEVKLEGAGYGVTSPRNGRFENDLVRQVKYTDTGLATMDLKAWDSLPGDTLWVRAIANVVAYGGATYTSDEFQINITNSTAEGTFYESALFTTPASFYEVPAKVPVEEVGNIFVQVRDCDENTDVLAADTVTVDLTSDNAAGIVNTLAGTLLTETDANSGVFRATVPIKRSPAVDTMEVDKGGIITGTYEDEDDITDTFSNTVPLTGCRELRVVDASDIDVTSVVADAKPFVAGFPEGDSSFRLIANEPAFSGNSVVNSVDINVCSPDESNTVTLGEEDADNGIFRIDGPALGGTHGADYIYVGFPLSTDPDPGGDSSLGVMVGSVPDTIEIVIPATAAACDENAVDVVNTGCSVTIPVVSTTETISAIDSGWYTSAGSHSPANKNYIVGDTSGTEYRNFFVFDLSSISGTIVSATLSVDQHTYSSVHPSETWTVYDVGTAISTLTDGSGGVGAFNDLGGGISYGSAPVTAATTTVTVDLNASALSALNAAVGGQFAFGGALTTLDAIANAERAFASSHSPPNNRTLTFTILK
jgi:prepilin-type N-terminal cleavage/methylation domain-containing protein